MTISTIGTSLTAEVTPGSGNYASNITVSSRGTIYAPVTAGSLLPKAFYISKSEVDSKITNYGYIASRTPSVSHGGVAIWSNSDTVIDNFGRVSGTYIGIFLPNGGTVNNFSTISGEGAGIGILTSGLFMNSGLVSSSGYGIISSMATVNNEGTIFGSTVGVSLSDSGLDNSGVLYGGISAVTLTKGGYITNSGTITGVVNAISASGILELTVQPGGLFNGMVIDYSGDGYLNLGGTGGGHLAIENSFVGFKDIGFSEASSWTLEGGTQGLANGQLIQGFDPGDTISLTDFSATTDTFVAGKGLILENSSGKSENLDIAGTLVTSNFRVFSGIGDNTTITTDAAACFMSGTRILTEHGNVFVEELKVGDALKCADGSLSPILWIGFRAYDWKSIAGNHLARPVRIRRHAIGFNKPSRDLYVSPDHSICDGGVLIHAWRLINGVSITQAAEIDTVYYFHVELNKHNIIFAENCPVESFLDTGCRNRFQNVRSVEENSESSRGAPLSCLPRLEQGPYLKMIRDRISARAGIRTLPREPGLLRGFVDEAGPNLVRGWAQDVTAPEDPVVLELLNSGESIRTIVANLYRSDLRKAGLGSGCHAFEICLPDGHQFNQIAVRRLSDGASLVPST